MKSSERKKDLLAKSPEELTTELHALLREQFGLRMQKATQQLTNHSQIGKTRRDIARAKTIQSETRLGIKAPAPKAAGKKTGAKK